MPLWREPKHHFGFTLARWFSVGSILLVAVGLMYAWYKSDPIGFKIWENDPPR